MRAIVINHAGGPEVLELREVPDPVPGPREVLVRVRATALNRADVLQRLGRYPAPPGAPADIPGLEFAGEVIDAGAQASRWRPGDALIGLVSGGSYAELLAIDEDLAVPRPEGLSWEEAAAIPEAFITAHDALVTQGRLASGETVLIHAVASGVGLAAVQVARAWGARPFGTTRTAAKLDAARSLGLEDGLVVDSDLSPLRDAVRRWTSGQGMTVTLDLAGGPYVAASILAAATGGRILLVGAVAGAPREFPLGVVLARRLVIRGTVLRSRPLEERIAVVRAFAAEVLPMFPGRVLRPVVDCVMPLADAAAAHRRMEQNASVGKIVLRVD